MKILVTGGAGYIGSFMTRYLLERGDEVIVVDSLERGHKETIDARAVFLQGDLLDEAFIKNLLSSYSFDGVIHFAGYISMSESMQNPYIYFKNNVFSSLNLIEGMKDNGMSNFIFSSTAGVYGNPNILPITEDSMTLPTNPYGESKLAVEKILSWYGKTNNFSYAALRYFNASGAAIDGKYGEQHDPETHIIPNAINSLLNGSDFELFGTDYKTKDGTCVRDYIHVLDLVEAHALMLDKLFNERGKYVYNVGTGSGYSNKEVVHMIEEVSGKKMKVKEFPRRLGDADTLIADSSKIRKALGFNPQYSDLKTIVESAWKWHSTIH